MTSTVVRADFRVVSYTARGCVKPRILMGGRSEGDRTDSVQTDQRPQPDWMIPLVPIHRADSFARRFMQRAATAGEWSVAQSKAASEMTT